MWRAMASRRSRLVCESPSVTWDTPSTSLLAIAQLLGTVGVLFTGRWRSIRTSLCIAKSVRHADVMLSLYDRFCALVRCMCCFDGDISYGEEAILSAHQLWADAYESRF